MDSILQALYKDYASNGARTLRCALQSTPDVRYVLPLIRNQLIEHFPLLVGNFEQDFPDWQDGVVTIREDRNDAVNHPSHYTQGGIECLDAMQAMLSEEEFVGYLRGSIFKYQWRFRAKGKPIEDLQKMGFYRARLEELCSRRIT